MDDFLEIESIKEELKEIPKFLTISQAARILGVNYFTVYRRIVVGEIDATKVGGIWRIPKKALIEYLQRRHPFNTDYL